MSTYILTSKIKNKILGLIYGQCLGDAVGLITEFKQKRDHPKVVFPYKYPIRGWPVGDWTDDSDHMILLMEMLTETGIDCKQFAQKLHDWRHNGFPELGDDKGLGLGGSTNLVLNDGQFLSNPAAAAMSVWETSGRMMAPNGALMRTSILSTYPGITNRNIIDICQTTHYDPRPVASCLVLNHALSMILRGDLKNLKSESVKVGLEYLRSKDGMSIVRVRGVPQRWRNNPCIVNGKYNYSAELLHYANLNLDELKLGGIYDIGYTYKCLGCGFWAMDIIQATERRKSKNQLSFKKIITKLAEECGDADTNCAVAGAVMGAYLGYDSLPKDWLDALPNKKWLDKKIDSYFITLLTYGV